VEVILWLRRQTDLIGVQSEACKAKRPPWSTQDRSRITSLIFPPWNDSTPQWRRTSYS
jgi:hypothetical protein